MQDALTKLRRRLIPNLKAVVRVALQPRGLQHGLARMQEAHAILHVAAADTVPEEQARGAIPAGGAVAAVVEKVAAYECAVRTGK
jgi:hypothetical protein